MPRLTFPSFIRKWFNAASLLKALPFIVLATFFFSLYQATGYRLKPSEMYDRNDVFFRTDTNRALKDIVGHREGMKKRTSVHPIFVLAHQPIGSAMMEFYRNTSSVKKYDAMKCASIFLTSVAGTGVVLLVFATLRAMGLTVWRGLLFTAVLGCSSTQMFFSSAPETYIFSALGLAAVAWAGTRRSVGETWWQVGAIYAAGNLTANLAPVSLWCMARHWQGFAKLGRVLLRVILTVTLTIILLALLSLLQKAIYPSSELFFLPSSVTNEGGWLYWDNIFKTPWATLRILLQHQWLSNIIGPEPVLQFFNGMPMASIEQGAWAVFRPAWPLFALWGVLLAAATTSLFRKETYTHPFVACLACLAFNFVFHSVFGNDRMLYAADWTLYSVIAVAWGLEIFVRRVPRLTHVVTTIVAIFLIAEAVHNMRFLDKCQSVVLAAKS